MVYAQQVHAPEQKPLATINLVAVNNACTSVRSRACHQCGFCPVMLVVMSLEYDNGRVNLIELNGKAKC